ncbi:MAG: FGGY family carbohydrate kinase, partial [Oscillospiraceae bacterium]
VETWLIWNLTGGRVHVTDYSNASRTMMFNIHTLKWDKDILALLDIPEEMLPKPVESSGIYGYTDPALLGGAIPVAAAAGDQQAALFGQCCFEKGGVKNTYGTGAFLLMNTGETPIPSKNGLLTTIAWGIDGKVSYALEGSVFVAGAVVQWLRDEMQLVRTAAETEEIALSVPDTNGVYIVPAFVGLGAPYWKPDARGIITGLTRGAGRAHIVRAALESIAYQSADVMKAMEDEAGFEISSVRTDGGASANNFLMQFQADILGKRVIRPRCVETTAMGAAYLAGLAVKFWDSRDELAGLNGSGAEFLPAMSDVKRGELLDGWKNAVGSIG